MGRKLAAYAIQSGFAVVNEMTFADAEFSFDGPAHPGVVESWRLRFDRMKQLRRYCGSQFEDVKKEFLDCLVNPDHRSDSLVFLCVARSHRQAESEDQR